MPVSYPIPPWLTNAQDPVTAYSRGLQIGAQIGESQAHQQLAQEQMLRQQQKDLVEQEIEKGKYQLAADEAARRYSAQQKFTQLINSGMSPDQAILQVPEIANRMSGIVQTWKEGQTTPFQEAHMQRWRDLTEAAKNKPKPLIHVGQGLYERDENGKLHTVLAPPHHLTDTEKQDRAADLKELAEVNKKLIENTPTGPTMFGLLGKGNLDTIAKYQKRADELKAKIASYGKSSQPEPSAPAGKKIGRFTVMQAPAPSASADEEAQTEGDVEEMAADTED